ncbi:hypothetical protein B0H11DRAFT_2127486 [Mycena galericulata]|nr:hypothetical protein B0H11DRAFT_2127486 [Mycena galericulata]
MVERLESEKKEQEIIFRISIFTSIGTIGHDAHGKSNVVKAMSGVTAVRFENELIYQCENQACPRPEFYRSYRSDKESRPSCERPGCNFRMKLVRHVSFVDCPGHDILMDTMLNGAAVMDAVLLLIAGNETCPQPQTSEHLAAVEIMKLGHIIILQNEVDLIDIKEAEALEHQKSIAAFLKGTVAESSPIVPISVQLKYLPPRLIVIRSFDVNKPGAEVGDLKGGVAGGSILTGILTLGIEIEVRPGVNNLLDFAMPGGLIGVGTQIDPTLCRADRLVGQVLGGVGTLPKIYIELESASSFSLQQTKVSKLMRNDFLLVNIGSTSTGGRVLSACDPARIQLTSPACTEIGEKVALSRRIDKHWRLIRWGSVQGGTVLEVDL